MFARRFNQIRIDLSITPRGPLLIRSGREGAHPERPSLEAVRTRVDGEPSVYIPGSSLKGVIRSYAEVLLRTEGLAVTDPFDRGEHQAFQSDDPCTTTYSQSCPIGRTFGNFGVKGHVAVTDLVPGGRSPSGSPERRHQLDLANRVERRNNVGIDRLLGGSAGKALFDTEAVVAGRLDGRILMINAQLYQLALVLAVLHEMDHGFVGLGSTSTRGFGQVGVSVDGIRYDVAGAAAATDELFGVGILSPEAAAYGCFSNDAIPMPPYAVADGTRLLWRSWQVPGEHWMDFARDLLGAPWEAFLSQAPRAAA